MNQPVVLTLTAAGSIKVDVSKAHSLFYLPCLRRICKELPWVELVNRPATSTEVSVFWHDRLDVPVSKFHISRLAKGQKMNRFLTMQYHARKNTLTKRLKRMQELFPEDFNFLPKSWTFPTEVSDFKKNAIKYDRSGESKYYIIKPDNGSKGQGIQLADYPKVIPAWMQMSRSATASDDDDDDSDKQKKTEGKGEGKRNEIPSKRSGSQQEFKGRQVCTQEYLEPYLLDGHKFDLRLYVVLESVNPMKAYLCRTGMVRKAMVPYEKPSPQNIRQLHMHLTNTSLNSNFHYSSEDEVSPACCLWSSDRRCR